MINFDKLHEKTLEDLKKYYEKQYPINEEKAKKNVMSIIKSKNFIKNHALKIGWDFQETNYKFLYDKTI